MIETPRGYGLMAEFIDQSHLLAAARRAYDAGYRQMDAYSPYPVEGLAEALHLGRTRVPLITLVFGLIGAATGYLLAWAVSAVWYPLVVAGRPYNSWPAFIPVTFELTILFAALATFFGVLAMNGLPKPYHPVFNVPKFALASQDRFFLCIEATDPRFDPGETRTFLESLGPAEVSDVPA